MKTTFIGAGKMATAILNGILGAKFLKPEDITVSDVNEKNLKAISEKYSVKTVKDNVSAAKDAEMIFICTKPFVVENVLNEIKSAVSNDKLIVSIAAGVSTEQIENIVGEIPVIRIMPNTPMLVNSGMSAVCKGKFADEKQFEYVFEAAKTCGHAVKISEDKIDAVTALSGSGPAFYARIITDMAKAAESLGLDRKTALMLSAYTASGTADLIMKSETDPEQLIVNVTTPGGCTAVGNDVLKENNITEILKQTIVKTAEKAAILGKKTE